MTLGTGKVDAEQPLMNRLMGLGIAAEETAGKGLQFAHAVSRRIWGGTENWHEGNHLSEAADEAGLSLTALETFAREDPQRVEAAIQRNEDAQMTQHWGVPLMVLDDEPFFGQDRLDSLVWRLDQKNLKRK
jgi:2-hydroxychromene-2-carboxylate isomerase